MSDGDEHARRVRFYGPNDLAAGFHAPRVAEIAAQFDPNRMPSNVIDVLELHSVAQYLEHGLLPSSCAAAERAQLTSLAPRIRTAVARFFASINESNFAVVIRGVDFEYHEDLLDLLGANKVFERTGAAVALPALKADGVHLGSMLRNKSFVRSYGPDVREELIATPRAAEYLIRKYLEKDARGAVHLPESFTAADARSLLQGYLDDDDANLNYVRLISTARDNRFAGIDAKLRLSAKRRSEELGRKLFEQNEGFKTGCDLRISDDQDEPVLFEVDSSQGSVWRYSYSRDWLEATTDYASILNNFQHLFEFTDDRGLLTFPAFQADFGVMERVMGLTGSGEYKTGVHFRNIDSRSLLQTLMYMQFLESQGIELEQVIKWFFESYLVDEFGIANFSFASSDAGTPYLQRVRHLFAEMEGVLNQFSLFVEHRELDRDLLTMGSDQIRYKEVPSLLDGKYLYASESDEMRGVLHTLFSDPSSLNYIDEGVQDTSAVRLLLRHQLAYDDFHPHQKRIIDHLIRVGVLENSGERIRFVSNEQLVVLASLFKTEAVAYFRLSGAGRSEADKLVARGWAFRRSSLLTVPEGDYFNYFLNRVGFSNGPNLRNAYLHGSQQGNDSEDVHFNTFVIAMRLLIALVIKINDDVCLSSQESAEPDDGSPGSRSSAAG